MNKKINYYAGIGARRTPKDFQALMKNYASRLENLQLILRSGGAYGADQAFESGVKNKKNKQIFYPEDDIPHWCYQEAENHLPKGFSGFKYWNPWIKNLIARNMLQVLGPSNDPSRFIVCWCPTHDYTSDNAAPKNMKYVPWWAAEKG